MFLRNQYPLFAPYIDAAEASALAGESSVGGELPGDGEPASASMLESMGIDPAEYEQILAENPDQGNVQSKGKPASKNVKKREIDHALEADEIMKELAGEGDEGDTDTQASGEDEEGIEDEEEEGEEGEDLPPAAKTKGELRLEDYTRKTQELSRTKKEFEAFQDKSLKDLQDTVGKLDNHYKQFDEKLASLDQWNYAMDLLKDEQPELWDAVQETFQNVGKQFKNPIINNQLAAANRRAQELEARLERLEKGNQTNSQAQTDAQIRSDYHKELSQTQAKLAPQLKQLGLKIDWGKVQQAWIKTGADTIEQAVYSVYGSDISRRYASMNKTGRTRDHVRLVNTPTVNRGGKFQGKKGPQKDPLTGSWDDVVNDILAGRISAG